MVRRWGVDVTVHLSPILTLSMPPRVAMGLLASLLAQLLGLTDCGQVVGVVRVEVVSTSSTVRSDGTNCVRAGVVRGWNNLNVASCKITAREDGSVTSVPAAMKVVSEVQRMTSEVNDKHSSS